MSENSVITYIPVALRGKRSTQECQNWFDGVAFSFGRYNVNVLTELDVPEIELMKSDAIYIGGGNTYNLLREIRQSGFLDSLLTFVQRGKPVYGGSAGAVVLGADIATVRYMDEDLHNTGNTCGLNIIGGYSVWPHYEMEDDLRIMQYVKEKSIPVLALPEDAGVCIRRKIRAVGKVWLFDESGKQQYV